MTHAEHHIAFKKWRKRQPAAQKKKGTADTSRNALMMEAASSLLASLLVLSAGWWMLEDCRKTDKLVNEYTTMLAEAKKAGTVENFLNLK